MASSASPQYSRSIDPDVALLIGGTAVSQDRHNLVVHEVKGQFIGQLFEAIWLNARQILHFRLALQGGQLPAAGNGVCIGELLGPRFQEAQAAFIGARDVQRLPRDRHSVAYDEVGQLEVLPGVWILHSSLVGKLPGPMAAIPDRHLEDCDLVVVRIPSDDEHPHFVFRQAIHHLGFKSQNLARVDHELFQVHLGCLHVDHLRRDQGVLLPAYAIVRWWLQLQVSQRLLRHIQAIGALVNSHVVLIEPLREVITVVQHHLAAPHINRVTDPKILRKVHAGLICQHGRNAMGHVLLAQNSPLKEDWSCVASGVAAFRLVELHGVVCQVVVDVEVCASAILGMIIPEAMKAQNLAVVEQKLRQLLCDRRSPHLKLPNGLLLDCKL
mmetsp:Transcript_23405/g.55593  ORF Transcript_23405/g.55593 Transcript_23405/m.55593 type:complete len:383 (-) Transcript_23405:768-1916(-)